MAIRTPFRVRKAHLRTICSECMRLQDYLNAATDVINGLASNRSTGLGMLHDLDEAHHQRDQVLRKFVEHLKTHTV